MWDNWITEPLILGVSPDWPEDFDRDLRQHPLVHVKTVATPPQVPWTWFPRHLRHLGLASPDAPDVYRVWFWGVPKGQEEGAFEEAVLALGRHRRQLPLPIADQVRHLTVPLTLAILTTPG